MRPAFEVRSAVPNLVEDFFRYTGIKMIVDRAVYITPGLNKYPFIYITADDLFDTPSFEAHILYKYLEGGGFVLIEPYTEPNGGAPKIRAVSITTWLNNEKNIDGIRKIIKVPKAAPSLKEMARKVLGDDIGFKVIPKDHDVFHSVFDTEVDDLDGAFMEGRLVLIYSLKKYGNGWEMREPYSLKVGVNMVVHALKTGEIAQQFIDDSIAPAQNSRQWWDLRERKTKDEWIQ
ncbi:DUF4159 domain-containing protein [Candidatus Latescibacterota bacterium]